MLTRFTIMPSAGKRKHKKSSKKKSEIDSALDQVTDESVAASMKEFEDLTFREISDALDIPLSTVKSRLYTALKQLQMKLNRFGSEAA